jgi:hypothetical protein
MYSQATIDNEGAAEDKKDKRVDDGREQTCKEQLLGHKNLPACQGGGGGGGVRTGRK